MLLSVSEHERKLGVKNQNLPKNLSNEKALEISWNLKEDIFSFKLKLETSTMIKRVTLSVISSSYDPLGFAAPFILKVGRILQELCCQGIQLGSKVSSAVKKIRKTGLLN